MKLYPILLYFYITLFIQNIKSNETNDNENTIEIVLYSNSNQIIKFINLNSNDNDNIDMYINEIQNNFTNEINLEENKTILIKLNFSNDYDINCEKLFSNINVIKNITFNNFNLCKNMSYMFSGCNSLEIIDFSTFKTDNINEIIGTFSNCTSLTTINL